MGVFNIFTGSRAGFHLNCCDSRRSKIVSADQAMSSLQSKLGDWAVKRGRFTEIEQLKMIKHVSKLGILWKNHGPLILSLLMASHTVQTVQAPTRSHPGVVEEWLKGTSHHITYLFTHLFTYLFTYLFHGFHVLPVLFMSSSIGAWCEAPSWMETASRAQASWPPCPVPRCMGKIREKPTIGRWWDGLPWPSPVVYFSW